MVFLFLNVWQEKMLSVMWTRRCDQTELHDKMQQKSGNLKLRGAKIRCKTLVLIMQLYAEYTALVAVLHFDGCMKYFAV